MEQQSYPINLRASEVMKARQLSCDLGSATYLIPYTTLSFGGKGTDTGAIGPTTEFQKHTHTNWQLYFSNFA